MDLNLLFWIKIHYNWIKFENSEVFPANSIYFSVKSAQKKPRLWNFKIHFLKNVLVRGGFFWRAFLYILKILPIKIHVHVHVWAFLEKVNILNVFFWKFIFFFSNCEILILIFDVNKSPISVTHQMTLYI